MSKPSLTKRNEVFNETVQAKVVSSRYDLSSGSHGSFRMGGLYPIYCRNDIHPGDKFSLSAAPFIRFMPMLSPALTSVDVELRYFFVPYRLLWSSWKPFISPNTAEQVNLLEPYIPNFTVDNSKNGLNVWNVGGSLYDYMGVASVNWSNSDSVHGVQNWYNPGGLTLGFGETAPYKFFANTVFPSSVTDYTPLKLSAYPYLAYNFIWNEYFRDENLDDEAPYTISDNILQLGPHNFFVRNVNWQKDYFASALPFVTQSVYGSAPVVQDGMSIEQLREASALTRWLELQAVGGHRYQESILTHFGVRVPDEAAQIPVYLGGGKCPVVISDIDATSSAYNRSDSNPYTNILGQLAGKGIASDSMFIDNFEFKEHGVLLGLMYVRPIALYADVTPKSLFRKSSRHDYVWPSFANLGDESIDVNELNPGLVAWVNNDFGYTMRYNSIRTSFDQVHGQLRPTESMEHWTQARSWSDYSEGMSGMFDSIQLSKDFIRCHPSNRIFADTTDVDNLVGDVYTFVDATRPVPNYVDPKLD